MSDSENKFIEIGTSLEAEQSQMFGKPCFKTGKKAFICFFEECMVFKLPADQVEEALKSFYDCKLFDPSGKGRAMKAWVQISFEHKDQWDSLAVISKQFVDSLK